MALLAPRWGGADEVSWAVRQVAAALACSAEVHVVTIQGKQPRAISDGVFVVHELATSSSASDLRRELILASLMHATRRSGRPARGEETILPKAARFNSLLSEDFDEPWWPGARTLRGILPDLVVVADHRQLGAMTAIDRSVPDVPVLLLPVDRELTTLDQELFGAVLDRCDAVLALTETQLRVFNETPWTKRAYFVGLPLTVNKSVQHDPDPYTGDTGYIFVLGAARLAKEDFAPERASLEERERSSLAELLRSRFASHRLAISAPDSFVVYDDGIPVHSLRPLERGSDLSRLTAWARVTVDLRPGPLFGRESLESLLYGTPIVVPENSAPRESAELASGGLWFDGGAQLVRCVEAMFDPEVRNTLGAQGRAYAKPRYGSPTKFMERMGDAVEGVVTGSRASSQSA